MRNSEQVLGPSCNTGCSPSMLWVVDYLLA